MTEHNCAACKHDCGCLVTEHMGGCVHHKHSWVPLGYDAYDLPRNYYCFGCSRYQRDVRREESEQRERERVAQLLADELKLRQEMGA